MNIQLLYTVSFPRWRILPSFLIVNKVDQPAGTGFSYASTDRYVHTIDTVGSSTFARCVVRLNLLLQAQQQLMEFLKNFYDVFPQYKTMDVRVFLLVVCFLLNTSF